jgi:hypothetical protein
MATGDHMTLTRPERRRRAERRQQQVRVAVERRRQDDRRQRGPAGGDGKSREEQEFQRAMEYLCRLVRYPTCRHVLQVAHNLGYRRAPTTAG